MNASERYRQAVEADYTEGQKIPEFVPYVPPKTYMEAYQRAHEYHTLPSLYGYEVR